MIDTLDEKKRRLLALLLKEKGIDPASAPILPLPRDGRPFPLSFSQERLWLIQELEPESTAYNLAAAFRLVGRLRPEILARAFTEIARRHEILRTTFAAVDEKPVQIVHPPAPFPIPQVDLSGLPPALREAEALRIAVGEPLRLFDLGRGPLMRVLLLPLAAEERVLLVTTHHIISDGWSEGVLIEEVGALYTAFSQGRPSPLPALPIQYADFASWQRQALSGAVLEGELAWWRRQLGGSPPVLELPTDRPRPPVLGLGGAGELVDLPVSLAEQLKALGRARGATLFMAILAALETLLARLSGQEDVSVGTPIASRNRTEIERLIGFFANTLVLRVGLSGDPTFSELLDRARRAAIDAFAHQGVPFSRVVEEMKPERSFSHTPLFQVLYVLQNTPRGAALETPGLRFESFDAPVQTAMYDLTFSVLEGDWGLSVALEYKTDLWDAPTVKRLLGHFETLLRAAVEDPGRRLSGLPLLTPPERQALLVEWNDTGRSLEAGLAVPDPDAPALLWGDRAFSYAEMRAWIAKLAARLRDLGVGPGSRMALSAERSPEAIAGLLAILETGAAYVPLDPAYPEERRAFMLEDSGATVVLTGESEEKDTRDTKDSKDERRASEDDLAYLIYTSGSTGRPKGVAMTRRALANLLAWQEREVLPGPARTLQFASLSFDVSFQEIASTWLTGGTLVLVSEETRRDPFALLALLDRERIERLFLPFVALRQLAEAAETAGGGESLRDVITAGEQLQVTPAVRAWFARTGARLHNQYGPSESHVVTALTLDGDPELWPALPPIGRPIANVAIHLLDPALEPVPVGVPGELSIGGVALARGYLDRPDLTAERFIPDPFGEAGERLYRTGDLARWRTDGTIEYLGRRDGQVKIRGVRVEPGEVETALDEHPGVRGAVVVPSPEPANPGALRLVAFYVPAPGAEPSPAELRGFLAARLPAAIVPSVFVPLEAFPTTPSGKVDRRALVLEGGTGETSEAYVPPRTPVEERLAGLWAGLLGVPRVGLRDNFFDLGGHSLLATQLLSRLRASFGAELPLRALFERPTIERLAPLVADEMRRGDAAPPLVARPRAEESPLSFAQQRLWFLHQLDPKSPAYNMYLALRLDGLLDEAALERGLRELARRQESLRARFVTRGARTVQVVSPVPDRMAPVVDLSALPERERDGEAGRLAREEAVRPFDLEKGPLLRTTLVRTAPAGRLLLLAMHHIVSDGWSLGVFVRELAELYRAFAAGEPSPLPPLPLQYADFAAWQREWLAGPVLEREAAWWRERLAGAPAVLDLPLDRPRPPVHTFHGGRTLRRMPAASGEALLRLGREREATPFMTLLALFAALLLRHTGQEDLVVGSPVANRNRRETEGVIGFFVNTLVFRTGLSGRPGFSAVLDRVRETALSAYTHQDLPFEKLVEELAPERSLRHTPLFQVMFVTGGAPAEGSSPAEGISLSVLDVENGTAKFDLTMIVEEAPEGLEIGFGYNTDLFFPTTIRRLLDGCEALLAGVAAEPDRPVTEIPLLSEAGQHQILAEWNASPAASAEDAALHELFFARAAERPDALALLSSEDAVTYGELAARALRLAAWLAEQGVGPEVPVGLLADRSPATIAGLLGILAAGGVYVPLDPSWPRERLAFVPEDAGGRLVLTREDLDARGERFPGTRVDPDNAAYVIYTSGSTGTPNGVVVPHRGAVNLLRQARQHYGVGPESRVLQAASPGFDASILEIFLALGSGGALVQVRDEERLTPAVLAERLNAFGVTTLVVTPAFLSVLPEPALKGVRSVSVGGEACPAPLAARWSPGRRFLNCYGPTEASIYATVEIGGEPSIGRPVAGMEAYLLDADLEPVPLGVSGELCLGGAGLARGYLGKPEKTAAKFIPNPFCGRGDRLYRTGDLARHRPDGRLEFLGRLDRQVKVRGVRIELGEIEAALAAHPQVEAAAVAAHGEGTDRFLAAYVVLSEPAPSPAELRRFLAESLPDALVPAAVVPLPALPLTPSGKVDRRALPVPGRAEAAGAVAPRNEMERFLAELWKEALGLPEIGVHDDFFELGGTSIKAAILTNLLEERLGEPVYVVALFDAPTIARLAVYLETHYRGKAVEVRSTRINEETVERFRALIPPLPPVPPAAPKNPRAVFLLSPPRSGSTLLRVMLAGNPALFAPPELELLGFNTLEERKAAFSGRYAFWAEGTVRALMEVEGCGAEEARRIMADAEERDLSVRDFYREIQEHTGGRLLVDKTPSYSLDRATLERAEADFEKPLYLHLLRHPYGMISSFEKARLEQVFFRVPHPFSRRELAELIWLTSQQNILDFLSGIESGRQLRLRFEDLVQGPRAAMERVCAFLGTPFTPAMLDPYEDTGRRMTDGIHALSRMVGDVKFHEHKAIDPAVAESWKKEIAGDFLGEPTWKMAESLGYRKKTAPSLVRLQPKGDRPPLVAVHPVGGNVLAYTELARELMPGGRPLWALQSAGLAGNEPHRRIELMAAAYVEEVLAARPAGPYPLLGWSLGGSIAFEMAMQLNQRGHEVPLLVLVDAVAPGTLPAESFAEADDAELLAGIAGDLAGLALPTGLGPDPARLLLTVYRANLEAAAGYRPAPWPGRALLLRASRTGEEHNLAPDFGWGALVTGGVQVVEIEGDHYSLLRSPRVVRLAREIDARLE